MYVGNKVNVNKNNTGGRFFNSYVYDYEMQNMYLEKNWNYW